MSSSSFAAPDDGFRRKASGVMATVLQRQNHYRVCTAVHNVASNLQRLPTLTESGANSTGLYGADALCDAGKCDIAGPWMSPQPSSQHRCRCNRNSCVSNSTNSRSNTRVKPLQLLYRFCLHRSPPSVR
ncbi:uncharacterized protein LOC111252086 isoform X2 [Varroa destructor]|uniref:Uncharacterized protein n=1 Tax=Varroa destructor TaxID=109461 RepID=A0A7M7KGM8_VARDE|nr:uncharacterized protein LOC111252086 isoform X2 [Varroa destructor]